MKISSRGRYALRVIIDLAENSNGGYIPLKDIALRQGISQKYIESIMSALSKAGKVEGVHGKGGGYKLVKDASEYSVGEILKVTEGDLAPITCLEENAAPCDRSNECRTRNMWKKLHEIIMDYFENVKLSDLAQK
ncbi:MAG: RrF2 family transcriptional regulator [Clostridia bacterium]|nr:RrF2 family transcriptional regulator [Clostridia bacterium]